MQGLQYVDYVPRWYWKFEILCHADLLRARYGVSLERGPFDKIVSKNKLSYI